MHRFNYRSKKIFRKKFKTSTDYLIIFIVINMGILVMSAVSAINTYKSELATNKRFLKQESLKAENILSESINEHSWQMRYLADKIMKSSGNLEEINKIITSHNKFDLKSNFDQFSNQKDLYWIDKNDNVVVKNKVGILKYPSKITGSYEVFNARENPWKLTISKELPYLKNGYSLMLTSFGVTDKYGKYLGSIISSVDISLVQNLLIKDFSINDGNIVILNSRDNKVVFQSNLEAVVSDPDFFIHKLGNIDYGQSRDGYVEDDILNHDIKYSYYKKLDNYPFIIISGYNYLGYKAQLTKLMLRAICPNIAIGLILLITLFLFYKRVVSPIKILSDIARQMGYCNALDKKFPKKINSPEIYELAKALIGIKYQKIKLERSNLELSTTKNKLEEAIETIKNSIVTHKAK